MLEKIRLEEVLGELATKLFSDEEKARLSQEISKEGSLVNELLHQHLGKSQGFYMYLQTRGAQKGGYRVGGKYQQGEAKKKILSTLEKHNPKTANKNEWLVYQSCAQNYLEAKHGHLQELLTEEVEFPDNFFKEDSKTISETFLKSVCDLAAGQEVYKKDLEALYEIWPLTRLSNFEEIIASLEDFGRVNELEDQFEKHLQEFEDFKGDIAQRVKRLRTEFTEDKKERIEKEALRNLEIEEAGEKLADVSLSNKEITKTHGAFEKRVSKLEVELDFVSKKFAEKLEFAEQDLENFKKLSTNAQSAIGKELGKLQMEAEAISQNSTSNIVETRGPDSGWLSKRFLELESGGRKAELEPFSEQGFLRSFFLECEAAELGYSKDSLGLYHRMVRAARIVRVSDPDLLGCWIRALGWGSYSTTLAASPLWSDPDIWRPQQELLAGKRDEPCLTTILDFDKGLVETYLEPVLRVWTQYEISDPTKKLFLVNSQSIQSENFLAFETPILSLDLFEKNMSKNQEERSLSEEELYAGLGFNDAGKTPQTKSPGKGVSVSSFLEWAPAADLNIPVNPSLAWISEAEINPPASLRKLVTAVEKSLSSSERVHELSFSCIILPWLKITQGEPIAAEIKKRFEENKRGTSQ